MIVKKELTILAERQRRAKRALLLQIFLQIGVQVNLIFQSKTTAMTYLGLSGGILPEN
jgi:hypothetical protein